MAVYGVNPMVPGAMGLQSSVNRRLSNQASGLQAAQAQMGVPGQMPAGPQTTSPTPRQPSRVAQLVQSQEAERDAIAARGQDLKTTQRLLQVLDPQMPKQARQFLYKELSRELGVDPKGEKSKEIGTMLTSLDPQTLEGLRERVVQASGAANPGTVQQLAKGLVSGQIGGDMIAPVIRDAAQPQPLDLTPPIQSSALPASTPAPSLNGGLIQTGSIQTGSVTPQQPQAVQPGGVGVSTAAEADAIERGIVSQGASPVGPAAPITGSGDGPDGQYPNRSHTPPVMQEADPSLTGLIGLNPADRYRNRDLMAGGWNRIPTNPEDQRKLATETKTMQQSVVSAIAMMNQLSEIVDGRPETMNAVTTRLPWIGQLEIPNPASAMVQFGEYINSLAAAMGFRENRAIFDPSSPGSARLIEHADKAARKIAVWNPEIQRDANDNARMQSILINLAYVMAATKGQASRHLSDKDVEAQLVELGRSASPEQFQAVLKSVADRMYSQYATTTRTQFGKAIPLSGSVTEELRPEIVNGRVTPDSLRREVEAPSHSFRRGSVDNPWVLGQHAIGIQPGDFVRDEGGMLFRQTAEGGLMSTPIQRPPRSSNSDTGRRVQRTSPTLEEEEASFTRRASEDRAYVRAQRAREEEIQQMRRRQEQREIEGLEIRKRSEVRTAEELRRKRIQDAFDNVARALVQRPATISGGGGGLISGGSLDQNPAAFQVAPTPGRRAPAPVNAQPFRR